ncbi:hypothetical protein HPP92_007171 [Vanilla planifolia]|uniref:Cytochrome P450 n=1 Tax=Vanilla planifolia TaxID=51239 RepID=A0A835R9Z1_VANPL|nr:hypothetical protein HPP92_007171 [Vanilla planifolia]
MLPALLAAILLVSLYYFSSGGWKTTSTKKNFCLPKRVSFIGNLHQLGHPLHISLCKLSKEHGPLILLHLGRTPTVVVSSAELAHEFMRTHDLCFANRPRLKVSKFLLYDGKDLPFAPYGEYWRQVKKLCITQLLGSKMVESFAPLRAREVTHLLRSISSVAADRGVISLEAFNLFTNAVMCNAVLGTSVSDERKKLLAEMIHANSVYFAQLFAEDYFPALWWLDALLGLEGKLRKHFKRWDALLDMMIEEHVGSSQEGGACFLDVLLDIQKNDSSTSNICLTKEHIKALLLVMIAAGTDTSFAVLDWTMSELVRNPNLMRKTQEEIRIIANGEATVREEHLSKMHYLKAVIKEVLRLHPPSPLLAPREAIRDCQIHGYEIPRKTRVLINAWAISRDRESWENPEEFRPERFLECPIDYKGNNFEYTPFGAGRRMCPGMQFATATIELVLANVLCFFDWKLPDGLREDDMDMTEGEGITCLRKQRLLLVPVPAKLK